MPRKSRTMPPAGFYVFQNILSGTGVDIVYTSGVPGGGGHKYYRADSSGQAQWCTLLWSCVPSIKTLNKHYTHYPNLPPGIPAP